MERSLQFFLTCGTALALCLLQLYFLKFESLLGLWFGLFAVVLAFTCYFLLRKNYLDELRNKLPILIGVILGTFATLLFFEQTDELEQPFFWLNLIILILSASYLLLVLRIKRTHTNSEN